jgi:hypothetical protein
LVTHALDDAHGAVSGLPVQEVTGVLPGQAMHW